MINPRRKNVYKKVSQRKKQKLFGRFYTPRIKRRKKFSKIPTFSRKIVSDYNISTRILAPFLKTKFSKEFKSKAFYVTLSRLKTPSTHSQLKLFE